MTYNGIIAAITSLKAYKEVYYQQQNKRYHPRCLIAHFQATKLKSS